MRRVPSGRPPGSGQVESSVGQSGVGLVYLQKNTASANWTMLGLMTATMMHDEKVRKSPPPDAAETNHPSCAYKKTSSERKGGFKTLDLHMPQERTIYIH